MTEVRRLRKDRGLTQVALAKAAQLSVATIQRMEQSPLKRKGGISISAAVAVARALEEEIDVVFNNFVLNPTQGRPAHTGASLNPPKHIRPAAHCPNPSCNMELPNSACAGSECENCSASLAA